MGATCANLEKGDWNAYFCASPTKGYLSTNWCPSEDFDTEGELRSEVETRMFAIPFGLCTSDFDSVLGSHPFIDADCHDSIGLVTRQTRVPQSPLNCGGELVGGLCISGTERDGSSCTNTVVQRLISAWQRDRTVQCPDGYGWFGPPYNRCVNQGFEPEKNKPCPGESNPVVVTSGNKHEREIDYAATGAAPGLTFERTYNSQITKGAALLNDGASNLWPIGTGWRHTYERRLQFSADPQATTWKALRPDGRTVYFYRTGSVFSTDNTEASILQYEAGGGYKLRNERNENEFYDSSGRLVRIEGGNWRVDLSYDSIGRLIAATNAPGRAIVFHYLSSTDYRISAIELPDGELVSYEYAPGVGYVGALTDVIRVNGYRR